VALINWRVIETPYPLELIGARTYVAGRLVCMVGREPRNGGPLVWHLSISHKYRIPTWDEMKDARYKFLPDDVNMAIMMPPRRMYVNVHATTMHLWEIPVEFAEEL
jgi:hypothetical protein